jgi:hypothetical protein
MMPLRLVMTLFVLFNRVLPSKIIVCLVAAGMVFRFQLAAVFQLALWLHLRSRFFAHGR